MLRLALLLLVVTLTAAVAAPAHAAQGDLAFFDCAGQGTFGCTDLNPTAGVLDDATAVLVVGNSVYTTASGSNAIAHFERAANGSLVYVDCVGQGSFGCTNIADDAIGGARALAADPDGEDVYVAGYRSDAVAAFRRNTTTGTLTYADCVGQGATGCTDVSATARPFDGASGVAVSPDGLDVYVVADRGNALAELDRTDATGAIAFAACDAQGGAFGCDDVGLTAAPLDRPSGVVVGPDGQQVFVVARDSASLAAFDRGAGGDLAFGSCIGQGTFGCATDITATAFVLYGASALAINAAGTDLYTTGEGADVVGHFEFDPATDTLSFSDCAGQGAFGCLDLNPLVGVLDEANAIAVSANGLSVYATGGKSGAVTRFAAAPATGDLTFSSCAGQGNGGCYDVNPEASGLSGPTGVAVSSNDVDVYATAFAANSVAHLRRRAKPACSDVARSTAHDTAVSVPLTCTDVDGDALTLAIVAAPARGTLSAIGGGSVTYTPAAGSSGDDTFTFRATDADGVSNTATATVSVGAAPAAVSTPNVSVPAPPPAAPALAPPPVPVAVAAAAVRFQDVVRFPSARRCVSRRRFSIRLQVPRGATVRAARVFVGAKRVRVVQGARLTAPVVLTGLPAGRFTVRIELELANGQKLSGSRRYKTCAKKTRRPRRS